MVKQGTEIPFAPHLAVRVNILRCRSSKVSGFWDRVWGGTDLVVLLACDVAEGPTEFYTKPFSKKSTSIINEMFVFVLPQTICDEGGENCDQIKIKFSILKGTRNFNADFIDVSDFKLGKKYEMVVRYETDQNAIKLDVEIEKLYRKQPDFRLALGLCDEEKIAVKKRKTHVYEHMQGFCEKARPRNISEVPTISVVCSGGGYRSTIQFCGAMEALQETGILDLVTYTGALSGGAWYVLAAYAKRALDNANDLRRLHTDIKSSVKSSMIMDAIVDFSNFLKYRKYAKTKEVEGQPVTFVDFYGFTLGKTLFGHENLKIRLSDLRDYTVTGEVPIPIVTAIHARSKVSTATFHADLEVTPWEVTMPQYALNMRPETFGSEWYRGNLVRQCPEPPLHFFLGATSSAFGILLKYYIGGETTETDSNFIANVRKHEFGRHKTKKIKKTRPKKLTLRRKKRSISSSTTTSIFMECDSDQDGESGKERMRKRSSAFSRTTNFRKSSSASYRRARMYRASVIRSRRASVTTQRSTESDNWHVPEQNANRLSVPVPDSNQNVFATSEAARPEKRFSEDQDEQYLTAEEDNDFFSEQNIITHRFIPNPVASQKIETSASSSRRESLATFMPSVAKERKPESDAYFSKLLKKISHHPLFTDREAVIDRTAKVLNFARGFNDVQYFPLNPEHKISDKDCKESMRISTEDEHITFVDPAVINNVPTNSVLRSERKSDIVIVCDATEYSSDTDIDYLETFIAEKLAKQQGLKFPKIDPNKLKDDPRGVIHVFEDEDDPECPTVIWITLCNKEYKRLENVQIPEKRRGESSYKLPEDQKFNDFPVYGPKSCYSTLNTCYSALEFDRLRELMKFNVTSNADDIKHEIAKKVLQKRASLGTSAV